MWQKEYASGGGVNPEGLVDIILLPGPGACREPEGL